MARSKQKYSIWKYCRTNRGWRYCRPAYAANHKIKANVVLVGGKEETHPEGNYYLYNAGAWELVGESALEAARRWTFTAQ